MEENTQKGNLDMETVMQGTTDTSSSTDAFFNSLESDVNSVVAQDNSTKTEQVTPQVEGSSDACNSGEPAVDT